MSKDNVDYRHTHPVSADAAPYSTDDDIPELTILQTQPLQTVSQPLDQMLPAQTPRVQLFTSRSEKDLGTDDVVGSLPAHLVEDTTHLDLGVSFGVSSARGRKRYSW